LPDGKFHFSGKNNRFHKKPEGRGWILKTGKAVP
jgi:hypothetical protein